MFVQLPRGADRARVLRPQTPTCDRYSARFEADDADQRQVKAACHLPATTAKTSSWGAPLATRVATRRSAACSSATAFSRWRAVEQFFLGPLAAR